MGFSFTPLPLEGAYLLDLPKAKDPRGSFVKTFHGPDFRALGLDFSWEETYYSISMKHVIRGLHFQAPPQDHAKLVHCPQGSLLDLILDLRKNSPSYGQFYTVELSAENHRALFIPPGFAHGFKSLEDQTMTHYMVSTAYSPAQDQGILFNSIGFEWGEGASPLISTRDLGFPAWEEFDSPF